MSRPTLFDVHTHVQFAAYAEDRDAVIERALNAGAWMVNVGTQRDTSDGAVRLAEKYPEGVYAAVGLHPIHTEQSYHDAKELGDSEAARGFTSRGEEFDYGFYKQLGSHKKTVAIGECGLDYYRLNQDTKEKQKNVFLKHIELAFEIKKPLMIHCRGAFADLARVLEQEKNSLSAPPGIIHFFSGSMDDAKKLLDLGFSFSFGGVITFARDYDPQIRYIPIDRILLETDAPYVTPLPYRGKRNEPQYILEVAKKLAELKSVSTEEVAEKTFSNAKKVFTIN